MKPANVKLITILGPTASGKTDLALSLAEEVGGEIICADSRTIYRGMDIGTAKPTPEEQARVPHHLLDVVDPGERLSVAAFKILAESTIADIAARGKVPFLVGGSGLYLDAVLFDYQFPPEADPTERQRLEALTDDELRELLAAEDTAAYLAIDIRNRRRLIRAIETAGQDRTRSRDVRPQTLVLGLALNKEIMQTRISARIEKILSQGFLEEVRRVGETYGWDSEAMTGVGYRAFKDVVLGTKTVAEGAAECARGDLLLVKKQLTWFKRNRAIHWLDDPDEAAPLVRAFLAT
jgi:tRNA dimethylallyltransferase